MPVGVTSTSREIYDLHMLIFWICVAIGVVVFGAMLYSMIAHRKSVGHEPANFHESTKLELAWTIVPVFILIGMAIPATDVLVRMYDFGGEDMADRGTRLPMEVAIQVPRRRPQRAGLLLLEPVDAAHADPERAGQDRHLSPRGRQSADHSGRAQGPLPAHGQRRHPLLVGPGLRRQEGRDPRDHQPGLDDRREPGIYRGQCTELCGKDHGFMPIVVAVLPQDEFDAWYAEQQGVAAVRSRGSAADVHADELFARGEEVYQANCAACHQDDGSGTAPVYPAMAGSDAPRARSRRTWTSSTTAVRARPCRPSAHN